MIIYPDGKIEQTFHYQAVRVPWFGMEGYAISYNAYELSREIPVPLWIPMPNKIVFASGSFSKSITNNVTTGAEADEYIGLLWNQSNQRNVRDRCYFNTTRWTGTNDEHIDIYFKVEGY